MPHHSVKHRGTHGRETDAQRWTHAHSHAQAVEVPCPGRQEHVPANVCGDGVPALQDSWRIVYAVNDQQPPVVRPHPLERRVTLLRWRLVKHVQPERHLCHQTQAPTHPRHMKTHTHARMHKHTRAPLLDALLGATARRTHRQVTEPKLPVQQIQRLSHPKQAAWV